MRDPSSVPGDSFKRSFEDPDEVITMPRLRSELVSVGALGVARSVHAPGWRWSVDLGPRAGTARCETRHVGYALRGRLALELADGTSFEVAPGEIYDIPPGHDAWVLGDEPFEVVEWVGTRSWLHRVSSLQDRVLATMVFTDIVASTATARRVGAPAWADLIAAYDTAMRDTVATYRGRTVKSTGDGVLAVFDGAARALRCASAMRAAASALDLTTRTAVHTGEVDVAQDDVHGVAVHEAARMLDVAAAGEIVVSATTRVLTDDDGVVLVDRGEHHLRGLDGPRTLFVVG